MKKYIILLITFFIITGCSKAPRTLDEKFLKNGYQNFEGNYSKKLNEVDYFLFDLTSPIKSFTYEENGINMNYFFQNEWAWVNNCSFDFKENKAKEGSECSKDDIEQLTKLRGLFEAELKNVKITVKDLIGEMRVIKQEGTKEGE